MGILFGRSMGCALHAALQNFMQLFIFPCAGKAGMSRLYLSKPCALLSALLHTVLQAQSAPGFPCALSQERADEMQASGENRAVRMRTRASTPSTSPKTLPARRSPASRP